MIHRHDGSGRHRLRLTVLVKWPTSLDQAITSCSTCSTRFPPFSFAR